MTCRDQLIAALKKKKNDVDELSPRTDPGQHHVEPKEPSSDSTNSTNILTCCYLTFAIRFSKFGSIYLEISLK